MKTTSFKKVIKVINDHLVVDSEIDRIYIFDNEEEKGEINIKLISAGIEIDIPLRKAKDPQ